MTMNGGMEMIEYCRVRFWQAAKRAFGLVLSFGGLSYLGLMDRSRGSGDLHVILLANAFSSFLYLRIL